MLHNKQLRKNRMKYDDSKFGLSLLGYLQLSISPRGLGCASCGRRTSRINFK
nr:MAG TPA: Scavenger receptor cysteine-rich domain [Caudoviricetes sp.]